jgi:ABC-type nitrate/sulfonate/bicarbonate transport system ATPase subunit
LTDAHPEQTAPVGADVPLISNQNVMMNISLIKEYHENWTKAQTQAFVSAGLERLGMSHIANRRNPALTAEERFCAMLLRAAMIRNALIVIDRPFQIFPHLQDATFLLGALDGISDLFMRCFILDYCWMKDKYGALCR